MKEYEEISGNKIFTNDEIKKLQEEENENIKKKKDFLNYRLYSIKKRQEKRIKVKESDFEGIKGKLNEIYRKYYEKLSDKKITSLEEFYDAIMISFSLYDQIENTRYILKKDEYYVMGDTETSFDSRYLGILRKKDFKSEVKLLIEEKTLEKLMDRIEGRTNKWKNMKKFQEIKYLQMMK